MTISKTEESVLRILDDSTFNKHSDRGDLKVTIEKLGEHFKNRGDDLLQALKTLRDKKLITTFSMDNDDSGYRITNLGHKVAFYIKSNQNKRGIK